MASGHHPHRPCDTRTIPKLDNRDIFWLVTIFIRHTHDSLGISSEVGRAERRVYSRRNFAESQMNGERDVKLESAWKLCSPGAAMAMGVRSIQSTRNWHNALLSGRWVFSPDREIKPKPDP